MSQQPALLPEDESRASFQNAVLHLKLDDGQSPKKEQVLSTGVINYRNYNFLLILLYIL